MSAITAVNLLTFAIVLALPVLALPALLAGATDDGLQRAGLTSLAIFALLAATVALLLVRETLLRRVGRTVQWARNGLRRPDAA